MQSLIAAVTEQAQENLLLEKNKLCEANAYLKRDLMLAMKQNKELNFKIQGLEKHVNFKYQRLLSEKRDTESLLINQRRNFDHTIKEEREKFKQQGGRSRNVRNLAGASGSFKTESLPSSSSKQSAEATYCSQNTQTSKIGSKYNTETYVSCTSNCWSTLFFKKSQNQQHQNLSDLKSEMTTQYLQMEQQLTEKYADLERSHKLAILNFEDRYENLRIEKDKEFNLMQSELTNNYTSTVSRMRKEYENLNQGWRKKYETFEGESLAAREELESRIESLENDKEDLREISGFFVPALTSAGKI